MKNLLSKLLSDKFKKELIRFLIVGGIAVAIDALTYYVFIKFEMLNPSWAKRVSFALGSIWAFFMNKYYTFEQKKFYAKEPFLFVGVYIIGWLLNSFAHDLILKLFSIKIFAFFVATGLSTCSNFIGQKWIVFRSEKLKS